MSFKKILLRRLVIAIGCFVGHISLAVYAYEGELTLPEQGGSIVEFEMRNEQPGIEPPDIFQIYVGNRDDCCDSRSPMAGRYSIDARTVIFDPAFDFIEGQIYTIEISDKDATAEGAVFLEEFTIKRSVDTVNPEIVAVFPSGRQIPENTLRFYIHFSAPMKPHVSSDYIKLIDAAGTQDTAAFMAFTQELWSEDRKRLTLLMDPGRIKRGVAQNLTLGPALQEGGTYSIVVEEGWPMANSSEKMSRFENAFTVSKAIRKLPDTDLWAIASPTLQSNDPLVIEFDRPFDYELLQSRIWVLDENGRPIPGSISIEQHERTWRFDRKGIWTDSQIQIVVDTQLEDVAGNNFIDLLDQLVGKEASTTRQKSITVTLGPSPN